MEANELMIGDWVSYKGNPTKIRTIEIYNVDVGPLQVTITYGDRICGLTVIDVSMLKPIPLTPEILEKNGWKQKKGFIQHGNFGNGPLMIWHTEDNKILGNFTHEMEISDLSSDRGFRVRFDCNYVHQLQHALKLCQIEKEIQL